jgi:Mn2+/Fe2+ NRAMP family transporter
VLIKLKSLGPGLLYAGAAIGVSHLVQSTKAGAQYGYVLIIAIVLAHLFKYPFLAIGPRYAHYSKSSLVSGYAQVGKWAIFLLLTISASTMFTVQAAVTIVTAGLAQKLTGSVLPAWQWSALLLIICFVILQVGKFNVLDGLMKVIMAVLAVSTLLAFLFSFGFDKEIVSGVGAHFQLNNSADLSFLIEFVGWMPAPLDIAIWHSIWTVANGKLHTKSLEAENFDFKVGFYGAAILGICFLCLGANILYGTDIHLEASAGKFATQVVDLFTSSLGMWSYPVIVIAAFTTMFSTTLTCLDALPSVVKEIGDELHFNKRINTKTFWMSVLAIGSIIILVFFVSDMKQMVRLATSVSFLTAPVLAYLSYRLFRLKKGEYTLWSNFEFKLAILGIVTLSLFGVLYLWQIIYI